MKMRITRGTARQLLLFLFPPAAKAGRGPELFGTGT